MLFVKQLCVWNVSSFCRFRYILCLFPLNSSHHAGGWFGSQLILGHNVQTWLHFLCIFNMCECIFTHVMWAICHPFASAHSFALMFHTSEICLLPVSQNFNHCAYLWECFQVNCPCTYFYIYTYLFLKKEEKDVFCFLWDQRFRRGNLCCFIYTFLTMCSDTQPTSCPWTQPLLFRVEALPSCRCESLGKHAWRYSLLPNDAFMTPPPYPHHHTGLPALLPSDILLSFFSYLLKLHFISFTLISILF